jgi:Haem-degrading
VAASVGAACSERRMRLGRMTPTAKISFLGDLILAIERLHDWFEAYTLASRDRDQAGRRREDTMAVHKGVGHYGAPITLDQAKTAMAAAEAKAKQNNWNVVISIVDSGGHMVMQQRLAGTQLASIRIAEGKARTAVEFRRPTKALEEVIAGGGAGLRYFTVHGANLMEAASRS